MIDNLTMDTLSSRLYSVQHSLIYVNILTHSRNCINRILATLLFSINISHKQIIDMLVIDNWLFLFTPAPPSFICSLSALLWPLKADPYILYHSDSIPLASGWFAQWEAPVRDWRVGREVRTSISILICSDCGFLPVAPGLVQGLPLLAILLLSPANVASFLCSLRG